MAKSDFHNGGAIYLGSRTYPLHIRYNILVSYFNKHEDTVAGRLIQKVTGKGAD